ncbi:hypothetical protein C8F01DRAFT_1370166 [Mycena amicta]|nr:hypothetical protein C8F01DRAFT_1370166 [Mycena amicta]
MCHPLRRRNTRTSLQTLRCHSSNLSASQLTALRVPVPSLSLWHTLRAKDHSSRISISPVCLPSGLALFVDNLSIDYHHCVSSDPLRSPIFSPFQLTFFRRDSTHANGDVLIFLTLLIPFHPSPARFPSILPCPSPVGY